jgi:hypothetical protein
MLTRFLIQGREFAMTMALLVLMTMSIVIQIMLAKYSQSIHGGIVNSSD